MEEYWAGIGISLIDICESAGLCFIDGKSWRFGFRLNREESLFPPASPRLSYAPRADGSAVAASGAAGSACDVMLRSTSIAYGWPISGILKVEWACLRLALLSLCLTVRVLSWGRMIKLSLTLSLFVELAG